MTKVIFKSFIIQEDASILVEEHKKVPDYDFLKAATGGGLIQEVPYFTQFDGNVNGKAFANEEGAINGMLFNPIATMVWKGQYDYWTPLHGPIVIYFRIKV